MTYSIVDSLNYTDKSFILQLVDYSLIPLKVVCNRYYDIDLTGEKEEIEIKTYQVGLRIFAALAVLLTLPITLIALAVKWWKREEWQRFVLLNSPQIDIDESEDREGIPEDRDDFIKSLEQEFALVQGLDKTLSSPLPNSWREYGKKIGEKNQTLVDYIQMKKHQAWPDLRPLCIQRIGTFSEIDLKIISIVSDYLHVFHNLPIEICQNDLTMEQLKDDYVAVMKKRLQEPCETEEELEIYKDQSDLYECMQARIETSFPRANGQYDATLALDFMEANLLPQLKKNGTNELQMIAFTNEDLFVPSLPNFVFGCAYFHGVGIWSNARFGDPSSSSKAFQTCLLRMMKISVHEFAHMRCFPHCTDYECNMGGYMNLKELDSRPLLYCLQDTAKICYLTHTSLLSQHKKILKFFENFNQTYELNCDFSKEIQTLKKRISVLEKSSQVN